MSIPDEIACDSVFSDSHEGCCKQNTAVGPIAHAVEYTGCVLHAAEHVCRIRWLVQLPDAPITLPY